MRRVIAVIVIAVIASNVIDLTRDTAARKNREWIASHNAKMLSLMQNYVMAPDDLFPEPDQIDESNESIVTAQSQLQ